MKAKRAIPAQVQPVVRRFTHVYGFGDDTNFVEVRMNKKRQTSWLILKSGVRERASNEYPLAKCLKFVEMGIWREINISV